MAKSRSKTKSSANKVAQKPNSSGTQDAPVSEEMLQIFKESFESFDELSEDDKKSLYGDQEYLKQFWKYFETQHPDVLDYVKEKDLPLYIKALEKT